MGFQLEIQNFQALFQKIEIVKIDKLLKFDACLEECLG